MSDPTALPLSGAYCLIREKEYQEVRFKASGGDQEG
jgi:hypothetical protein